MSIVQPENGLPERRMITADSFRALKLRLSGASPPAAKPVILPPTAPAPVAKSIEALPEIIALPHAPAFAEDSTEVIVFPAEAEPVVVLETPISAVEPQFEVETVPMESEDDLAPETISAESLPLEMAEASVAEVTEAAAIVAEPVEAEPAVEALQVKPIAEPSLPAPPSGPAFIERRVLEKPQPEDVEAGQRAHELLDIMAIPTSGSLPQERALANDTLLRLLPRMPLKSLRHLAERVCLMEAPSQMLVRRLINDPRIEVSGPLLENAMTVNDSDLIAVATANNPAKLKLIARRRIISPALSEALIQSNHVDTLINLIRNQGASFSIESMWRLTRFAAAHPVLQAPLVTRQDTPSPIAFQLFWRLPSELRRYVLSRFLTDSETITKILTMNRDSDEGTDQKYADLSLLSRLEDAEPQEAGEIYARLTNVSEETGARIADDAGGEALTVALKAAGLTRAQFSGIVENRADADALKSIFETLSFNKARVLLTYWDWAAKRTGPYARTAEA